MKWILSYHLYYQNTLTRWAVIISILHLHLSLNSRDSRDTTGDLTTSFLHLSFTTALRDFADSKPVHSLMLSSKLFFCLHYLLPSFTVPCKMVLTRPDEQQTMSIPLQFARLYDGQDVFMWSDCLLDLCKGHYHDNTPQKLLKVHGPWPCLIVHVELSKLEVDRNKLEHK